MFRLRSEMRERQTVPGDAYVRQIVTKGFHYLRIESSRAISFFADQQIDYIIMPAGWFIGARRPQRVINIGDSGDAGGERNVFTGPPAGITLAIEPLVMPESDIARHLRESARFPAQDIRANLAMAFNHRALLGVERSGLFKNFTRQKELANVVEMRRLTDHSRLLSGKTERLAETLCNPRDPDGMTKQVEAGMGLVGVDKRCGKALEGAGAFCLLCGRLLMSPHGAPFPRS